MKQLAQLFISLFVLGVMFACNEDGINPDIETFNFTDSRDNITYKTVVIGGKEWMAENLAYDAGAGCWAYDNDEDNVPIYGRLYTWDAAENACPNGWHLPSDEEWKQLEKAIGMSQIEADKEGWRGTNEGTKIKTTHGWNRNGNGTDNYGFSALPGGFCFSDDGIFVGSISSINKLGYWWSSSEKDTSNAWYRWLHFGEARITRSYSKKELCYSVRCVKD